MGVGYGNQELTERVIHWEMNGNKVHLRDNNYDVVADPKTPIAEAVDAANNSTIIMTFPVAAFAKDGAPVIEVTRLYFTDVPEISARQRWAPPPWTPRALSSSASPPIPKTSKPNPP